jgi:uncharacterized membrane protein YjjP (DUF1212 family)
MAMIKKRRRLFTMRINMTPAKEKLLIAVGCGAGIALVAYGMMQKNNLLFILGIVAVILSYLAIRRKLKADIREKNSP